MEKHTLSEVAVKTEYNEEAVRELKNELISLREADKQLYNDIATMKQEQTKLIGLVKLSAADGRKTHSSVTKLHATMHEIANAVSLLVVLPKEVESQKNRLNEISTIVDRTSSTVKSHSDTITIHESTLSDLYGLKSRVDALSEDVASAKKLTYAVNTLSGIVAIATIVAVIFGLLTGLIDLI